jgi:streptogramin lyase
MSIQILLNLMKFSGRILLVFFILIGSLYSVEAQNVSYNQWLDHLPYKECKAVAEAGNRIYAATPYSVFYFDKTDNSLNRLNKVTPDGLSDIGISSIAYCSQLSTLVVAYSNTNIDLVKSSGVVNIPDIKRKQILGNKTINSILVIDKLAYLSCGFGIVVLDIAKEEIKDTYYIGPSGSQINVLSLTFHQADSKFYAATERGIYSADATTNLAYYVNWIKDNSITGPNDYFNLIASFGGNIYTNKAVTGKWDGDTMYVKNNSIWSVFRPTDHSNRFSMKVSGDRLVVCNNYQVQTYKADGSPDALYSEYKPGVSMQPKDAIIDKENKVWVADNDKGMWSFGTDNTGTNYIFDGPVTIDVAAMDISGKQLWAVPGGRNASFGNLYKIAQCYTFANSAWSSFNYTNIPAMADYRDVLCVAADPLDGNHAFAGTWGYGVLEFKNGELKETYTPQNSSLQFIAGYGFGYVRIGGVAVDQDNNLWVTNAGVANILSMRKPTGEWKSYNLSSLGNAPDVGGLVIDQENQKWILGRNLGLYVFNDNYTPDNTADDKMRKLTSEAGNGALTGTAIYTMAVDRNGELWLGSDLGVSRIVSPGNVFNGGDYDAHPVEIVIDGLIHPLLATELITAITVNGNNEKWIGTDKSGVFLMSADGGKELMHFTEADSPLLSNTIQSIKIASNGEVYFGTSLGIVSYKDYKVESKSTLDSLFIYPNPVRPEYSGPVFISNLVDQSNVKITDVTGALVWETLAQGGQVIWDGSNLEHRRVNTGVYLVFVTNSDGSQKKTGKILFVR